MCPNHLSLLSCIFIVQFSVLLFLYRLVFCFCFFVALRTILWKVSIFCAFYFVSAQSSVLKILRRTDSEIFLEHSAFLFLLNAAQDNCFLLLMTRYFQFFQLWSDVLQILYSLFCLIWRLGFYLSYFWYSNFHFFFGIETCYPRYVVCSIFIFLLKGGMCHVGPGYRLQ